MQCQHDDDDGKQLGSQASLIEVTAAVTDLLLLTPWRLWLTRLIDIPACSGTTPVLERRLPPFASDSSKLACMILNQPSQITPISAPRRNTRHAHMEESEAIARVQAAGRRSIDDDEEGA